MAGSPPFDSLSGASGVPVSGEEPSGDPFQPFDKVRQFLCAFDRMRTRPTWRQGDVPLPIVSISGPAEATAAVAQALEERCEGTPYARLTTQPVPEPRRPGGAADIPLHRCVGAALGTAAHGLAAATPRGEPRLRFPLLTQVLWLLELQISALGPDRLREEVRREIRQRRQLRRGNAADQRMFWANVRSYADERLPFWASITALAGLNWVERLTMLVSLVIVIGCMVAGAVHVLLRSRPWTGRHRYRWLLRQPYLSPPRNRPHNFVEFAVRVLQARRLSEADPCAALPPQDAGKADHDLACLLVNAFLEDLRQEYRRGRRRPWRRASWARTVYPVLLLDGPDMRLVQLVEEVRATTCSADPLLVVVMGRPETSEPGTDPALERPVRPEQMAVAWQRWGESWAKDRALGSRRVLRIGLEAADTDFRNRSAGHYRGRRRPFLAHPALPWLVTAALVLSFLTRVVEVNWDRCAPGIRRVETGECIGISDGSFVFHKRLKTALKHIQEANESILESGRPYVTAVYIGGLSRTREPAVGGDDLLSDVHGELLGLALAQRELIRTGGDGSKLQLRLLVANSGHYHRFAEQVARQVLELAEQDPTVVGVLGLGESHRHVDKAIRLLGQRSIPMISTTATFDDMGRLPGRNSYIPSLFPLAPPNSVLAEHTVRWALEGIQELDIPALDRAIVFTDTTAQDLYGKDLGRRYLEKLGNRGQEVSFANSGELAKRATEICSGADPPKTAFYAGRAEHFKGFLTALTTSGCGQVTVFASDGVTQYANDHATELSRDSRVRLLFTPLASPTAWKEEEGHRPDFYGAMNETLRSLRLDRLRAEEQPSREYAAQGRDAADILVRAAQAALIGQGGHAPVPDRGGVLLALQTMPPVDGASGLIKLHGAANGHHALDRPVLLVTLNQSGEQVLVRQCGRLYAAQEKRC